MKDDKQYRTFNNTVQIPRKPAKAIFRESEARSVDRERMVRKEVFVEESSDSEEERDLVDSEELE